MEGELFAQVYAWVQRIVPAGPVGCHYSDRRIVLTYLWTVPHDRPVCWACQQAPQLLEVTGWADRPSRSTMSRRLAPPPAAAGLFGPGAGLGRLLAEQVARLIGRHR